MGIFHPLTIYLPSFNTLSFTEMQHWFHSHLCDSHIIISVQFTISHQNFNFPSESASSWMSSRSPMHKKSFEDGNFQRRLACLWTYSPCVHFRCYANHVKKVLLIIDSVIITVLKCVIWLFCRWTQQLKLALRPGCKKKFYPMYWKVYELQPNHMAFF